MWLSPFRLALARYARIRRAAFQAAAEEALRTGVATSSLSLTDIDEQALSAWRETWHGDHGSGEGNWDWERLTRFCQRRPSAFHVAIWSGERLCGLAVGRMSARRREGVRHTISVHYIEGAPGPRHPLAGRIVLLAITAAEHYGSFLGAWRLRLADPLPGLVAYYQELGFTVVGSPGKQVYCERRIEP